MKDLAARPVFIDMTKSRPYRAHQTSDAHSHFVHRWAHTIYLLLITALSSAVSVQAATQDSPEMFFILDGSGSMWGEAGGRVKIDAAKDVIAEVVPSLDPGIKLGLMAYGHRRKGDCSDIEILVPAGSNDRQKILKEVAALKPLGKTPISDAVLAAAEQLKTREAETTIVLVSDGIETCATDPCQVVRKLKSTGIKFVLHVVGFGVDAAAKEQLHCMANEGGGAYFGANDQGALLKALLTVKAEVAAKVETAKSTRKGAETGLPKLVIKMPESASEPLGGVLITKATDKAIVKETSELPANSTHPLPPGKYQIAYTFRQPNYGEPTVTSIGEIELQMGDTKRIDLGAITFNMAKILSRDSSVAHVILADSGSGEHIVTVNSNNNGAWNFAAKAVLPGIYDVLFHYSNSPSPAIVASKVVVSPLKETIVTLNSGIVFKEATSTNVKGWDLIPLPETIANEEEDGEKPAGATPILLARPPFGNKSTLWMPYIVPPGKYSLHAHIEGMAEALPIAPELVIQPGETLEFESGL